MNDGGIPSRRPAPSCVTSDASPWTSVGARTIGRPERRRPSTACPGRRPRTGISRSAATSIAATDTPASSGSPGPGRDHDAAQVLRGIVGQGLDAGPIDGVVADDPHVGPRGLERLDEVEREAVVVVDDEDHDDASPRAHRCASARRVGRRRVGHACGEVDRPPQRRRLVVGLLELPLGTEPATMPGAGVDVGLAVLAGRRCGS